MFGFHRWINAWRTQDDSQSLTLLKPNPQTKKEMERDIKIKARDHRQQQSIFIKIRKSSLHGVRQTFDCVLGI